MAKLLWLVPLLAGVAAYAIAPFGDLVWDDEVVREQLHAFPSIAAVLQPPAAIPYWSYSYYRPLTLLSYVVDLALFGDEATAGPHLANVFYHLLTVFCVCLLALRVLARRPNAAAGAMVAATLFAVHPIHTESVSWITGRSDLLATMFLVPACVTALRWRERESLATLSLSPLLFLLALLAKEVAIAGLAILPVLLLTGASRSSAPAGGGKVIPARGPVAAMLPMVLAWAAVTVFYLMLRPGSVAASTLSAAASMSLPDLAMRLAKAASWYALKLAVPWPQSNFVGWELLPSGTAALALLTAAAAALAASAWHWRGSGNPDVFAGLAWTAIAIMPSLAVVLPGVWETPVAERYLYLPSVGAAVALGAVYCQLASGSRRQVVSLAASVLAFAWLAATVQRGTVWLTDARLWADSTSKVTTYGIPWVELGESRLAAGDEAGALDAFLRARAALMSDGMQLLVEYKLGELYGRRGNWSAAIDAYTAAIAVDPGAAGAHYELGNALLEAGRAAVRRGSAPAGQIARAVAEFELALLRNPALDEAHLGLASAHLMRGEILGAQQRSGEARASYESALMHLDAVRQRNPFLGSSMEASRLREQLNLRLREPGPWPP